MSAAQKAKGERKSNPQSAHDPEQEEEVVLTRADKRGMVRPLPDRQHPVEPKGGRRKAGKVGMRDVDCLKSGEGKLSCKCIAFLSCEQHQRLYGNKKRFGFIIKDDIHFFFPRKQMFYLFF